MSLNRCPRCQSELSTNAPQGLCPACLLERAVHPFGGSPDPSDTAAHNHRFVPPSVEELNARFTQLEILEPLGQGGMGAVYKARQTLLDRVVAVKILAPEMSRDPAFAERFTREARALAKLTHPNIVTVFEFGENDGLYYLLMEFVDGVNLREAICSNTLGPADALAVVSQVCDALQYAHDEGIVHRDIKPENVLLDTRGRVKIADFGLAKLLGLSPIEVTLTATHQVMGTIHYMAPEQLERPLEVDHRADIYSLGVVFYELLTGELPLGRFKLPSEKRSLDVRLDEVVLKTLEREPKQRYQHVSEVKTAVDDISSSNATASPNGPIARPAPMNQSPTVPFALRKGGMTLAHGVMRSVGDGVVLEFEVAEHTARHPWYSNLKAGLHEVTIGFNDILAIRLKKGWLSGTLQIQTDSVRSVAGVPSADRGRASLAIASQDFDAAEQFARGIGPKISGKGNLLVTQDPWTNSSSVHPGRLGLCIVMIALGGGMLTFGLTQQDRGYLWSGFGVALGGACIGASAFWRGEGQSKRMRIVGPRVGLLVMAMFFVLSGAGLLIAGCVKSDRDMIWIGFGIAMVGGGCWSGTWRLVPEEDTADQAATMHALPAKPPKLNPLKPGEFDRNNSKLNIPAIAMCLTGAIDCLAMFGAIGFAIYVARAPSAGPPMPGVLELIIIGGGCVFGVPELIGGINMLTRRSHAASIVGALCGSIPCGFTSFFSMPFGIWALIVLNTPAARREFELAAESREQAAIEREEY